MLRVPLLSSCIVLFIVAVVVGVAEAFEFDRDSCDPRTLLPRESLHPVDNGRRIEDGTFGSRLNNDDDGDLEQEVDDVNDGDIEHALFDRSDSLYKLKPANVSSRAPYTIVVSSQIYRRNRPLTVTIVGPEFNGFILLAMSALSLTPTAVGSFFSIPPSVKYLNCHHHQHDAAVHKDTGGKMNLKLNWRAPTEDLGNLKFRATVVQKDVFWPRIDSDIIKFNQFPPTFSGCGEIKSCYRYSTKSPNCVPDECDYVVITRTNKEANTIDIIIGGIMEESSGYIGIGFTLDKEEMTHMDFGACIKNGNRIESKQYIIDNWNDGPKPFEKIFDEDDGDLDQNMIWCHYQRPLKGVGQHLADLTQSLHHAFMWGTISNETHLPILVPQSKVLLVHEPWNFTSTINMIHFAGGKAAPLSAANFVIFLLTFLYFLLCV